MHRVLYTFSSLLHQHVPDTRPVPRADLLLYLFLAEPLEVLDAHVVVLGICLAAEDPALHEERLVARQGPLARRC